MRGGPFWKEVKHPTTFDWWEVRYDYSSCRLRKFSSVKTHFFINRGCNYLEKIIKKCRLRLKNDLLIYCPCESVVQCELLPGNFWTFEHTSNYARTQALNGSTSDWAYSKYGCKCKLQQTLVKSLKICLNPARIRCLWDVSIRSPLRETSQRPLGNISKETHFLLRL